jgi:hypothetical protein
VEVKGNFATTEFQKLDQENLHFLRIFIHCDGKIRDIEKALGISYPTVKARLAELKIQLGFGAIDSTEVSSSERMEDSVDPPRTGNFSIGDILNDLKAGVISMEDSLLAIKKTR